MAKKILLIAGDFTEDYELIFPYQALRMIGHHVDTVCPDKVAGDTIKTAIHDFEGDQTYTEKPGHNFALNADFANAQESDYDALVLPGGRGPEYLRTNEAVLDLIRDFHQSGKPIAATCHAPAQLLTAAGVTKDVKTTCYPACAPEITLTGAEYVEIPIDGAMTDKNVVSSPAWPGNDAWMSHFLKLLGTKIEL
mgnify:FL=1|jgi:protease I